MSFEDKNKSSPSFNIFNENKKEDEEEIQNEYKIIKKEEKINLKDLERIITESKQEDKIEKNKEEKLEEKYKKMKDKKEDSNHPSQDEILENELSIIKKKNLSKYLMVNNQFKPLAINESERNIEHNKLKYKQCKLYKFVGKTLFIFLDKYENPLIIIGPDWPMYICFCGIITLIMLVIYLTLWKYLGFIMRILGYICFFVYFISYTHCSLYNPGYPKNDDGRNFGYPKEEFNYCSKCKFYVKKNNYVYHCFDCDICIEKHDHHCPWTGHCIGKNNYYTFVIFVTFSFFIIIYIASAICIGTIELM